MRKNSIISVLCASTLLGLTTLITPVYADVTPNAWHVGQTFKSNDNSHGQALSHQYGNHIDFYHDNGTGQIPSTNKKSSVDPSDTQQIVTQFQEAIQKYQHIHPGQREKDKGKVGKHPEAKDAHTRGDTADESRNVSTGTTANSTNNATQNAPGLSHSPSNNVVGATGDVYDKQSDANAVAPLSKQSPISIPSNSSEPSSVSSTAGTTDSNGLIQALSQYQTAANNDETAQTDFSNSVSAYIQALHDAANQSNTSTLTAHQKDSSAALSDVQSALDNQNQVDNLLATLKEEATKHDTSTLIVTLTQMTKLESEKVSLLENASKLLSSAATDIESVVD